jgi:hypothetical protein
MIYSFIQPLPKYLFGRGLLTLIWITLCHWRSDRMFYSTPIPPSSQKVQAEIDRISYLIHGDEINSEFGIHEEVAFLDLLNFKLRYVAGKQAAKHQPATIYQIPAGRITMQASRQARL